MRRMNGLRWVVVAVLAACSSPAPKLSAPAVSTPQVAAPAPRAEAPRPPDFRLPGDVRPTAYVLDLHVDPAAATVTGTVTIDVAVAAHTPALWPHAAPRLVLGSELDIRETTSILLSRAGPPRDARPRARLPRPHIAELLPRMREDTAGGFVERVAAEF